MCVYRNINTIIYTSNVNNMYCKHMWADGPCRLKNDTGLGMDAKSLPVQASNGYATLGQTAPLHTDLLRLSIQERSLPTTLLRIRSQPTRPSTITTRLL